MSSLTSKANLILQISDKEMLPDSNSLTPAHHVFKLCFCSTATVQFIADRLVTLPPRSRRTAICNNCVLIRRGDLQYNNESCHGVGYPLYFSKLIRFARVSSRVSDFYNRKKFLTVKLLKHGY